MKNLYISGIAGMLGSNLAYLLKDKYNVFGIDRNFIDIKGVLSEIGSIHEMEFLSQRFRDFKIDIFVHCAALVNVDACEKDPEKAFEVNTILTEKLSELCQEMGIKMIFISSDAVFGGDKQGLYSEEEVAIPINIYGKSKLLAEKFVLNQPRNLVIRTNIYGFNYREKLSFGEWIINSLEKDLELNMADDIFFSPILVNDLINILDLCIKKDLCGLFHICGTGSISKYEISLIFREKFGYSSKINKVNMKDIPFVAPRTKNMGLDNSKIKEILSITIRTPIESVDEFHRLSQYKYSEKLKKGT